MHKAIFDRFGTVLMLALFSLVPARSVFGQDIRTSFLFGADSAGVSTSQIQIPIYFLVSRYEIQPDYKGNAQRLAQLRDFLQYRIDLVDSVQVHATTSPEGSLSFNRQLAMNRVLSLSNWIQQNSRIQHPLVQSIYNYRWTDLLDTLQVDPALPNKEKVLEIIQETPNDEVRSRLLALDHGQTFRYLDLQHLYRYRSASSLTLFINEEKVKAVLQEGNPEDLDDRIRRILKELGWGPVQKQEPVAQEPVYVEVDSLVHRPLLAVKSNLLMDALLAPNIEVEFPIGRRYSLNVEWMFPWYVDSKKNHWCYEMLQLSLEGRYWLTPWEKYESRPLAGWYVGLQARGGYYDFEFKDRKGYQGEHGMAGITVGYSKVWKKHPHWNWDFGFGIGALYTEWRHYHLKDCKNLLIWDDQGHSFYVVPTQLRVSLSYLFYTKKTLKVRRAQL